MAFDQKRVLNRLDVLSRKAEELGQISAAARCEELIGKHRGMFVDRTQLLWDLDPDTWTPDQLARVAEAMIIQAMQAEGVEATPEKVADVRRRLEAGEVIETTCTDVTEPKE